ncbi:MAG: ABC transporter permease [Bacillota bacterium]|nr:ABC transporter permease [Bacillota bacterium]
MSSRFSLRQFQVVLSFEYASYLRNKVYVGITIAFILLIGIGLSLPSIIGFVRQLGIDGPGQSVDPGPEQTIHVIDEAGLLEDLELLRAAMPQEIFAVAALEQLPDLRKAVNDGEARAILHLESAIRFTLIERRAGSDLPWRLQQYLTVRYREQLLASYGLAPGQVEAAMIQPEITHVETVAETGKTMEQAFMYTYLLLFLLYFTVMMYGQLVASSVASEKSNRAMEMLITSTKPMNLMFGKVIGSGLAGLTQIGLFILTAGVFYGINREVWSDVAVIRSIFQMPVGILVYTILFYLLGYFMYAFLYGALGSLASRTEDINTSIMPVILVIMAAMFISLYGMISPESGVLMVFSFVPFVAPMSMFVRISMTEVPAWQIALSIAGMFLTIYGTGWLSSRIYRLGVLMYGKPPHLGELLSLLRQAGK